MAHPHPSVVFGTYQYLKGGSTCTKCPIGFAINKTGSVECDTCKQGTFADFVGLTLCKKCTVGRYSKEIGQTEKSKCLNCQFGEYSDQLGATFCKECSTHFYSDQMGSLTCKACESGQYSYESPHTKCTSSACPVGTYISSTKDGNRLLAGEEEKEEEKEDQKEKETQVDVSSGGDYPPHCSVCPNNHYSSAEDSPACLPCQGILTTLPGTNKASGCLRANDQYVNGNVGLNQIVLLPSGTLLWIFNKSHPLSTSNHCNKLLHSYYYQGIMQSTCNATGYMPTCSWEDENTVATIQLVNPIDVQNKMQLDSIPNQKKKNVQGVKVCNSSQVVIHIGSKFMSPIAYNYANVATVQQYCQRSKNTFIKASTKCQLKKNKCSCVQNLMEISYQYEIKTCKNLYKRRC